MSRMIDYSALPEHMQEAMQLYMERGILPGSFLTAVLENNLMEACGRADDINRGALFTYCSFLYNDVDLRSYGSPEKVKAWSESKQAEHKEE